MRSLAAHPAFAVARKLAPFIAAQAGSGGGKEAAAAFAEPLRALIRLLAQEQMALRADAAEAPALMAAAAAFGADASVALRWAARLPASLALIARVDAVLRLARAPSADERDSMRTALVAAAAAAPATTACSIGTTRTATATVQAAFASADALDAAERRVCLQYAYFQNQTLFCH